MNGNGERMTGIRTGAILAVTVAVAALGGCAPITDRIEVRGEKLFNSLSGVNTVVVAPMMNLSTNRDVDLVETTNAFASELQQVQGLTVVPLGRVYQYLAQSKVATVGSPEEARQLAKAFGAQACIVAAVTEYDPYNPPRVGLTVQMFTVGELPPPRGTPGFDPVEAEQAGVPLAAPQTGESRPRDVLSHVFSGRNVEVEHLAQKYARERMTDSTPFGWRRFVADQHEFVRLCCYGMIREMLGEQGRAARMPGINVGPGSGKWPK
jgi:hypothetical protein